MTLFVLLLVVVLGITIFIISSVIAVIGGRHDGFGIVVVVVVVVVVVEVVVAVDMCGAVGVVSGVAVTGTLSSLPQKVPRCQS